MKNVVAIIQARCGSSRLPNKVFADICGHSLIWHVVNRLKHAKTINKIIIATTISSNDDKLSQWALDNNIEVYRGSENDVLNRFYEAAQSTDADIVIRITADDPLKDPDILDRVVNELLQENIDVSTNNLPPTFPEGLDVEAFTKEALIKAEKESDDPFEREHVTQYFYHNPHLFKIHNILNDSDLSYLRWTIDENSDLEMIREIYSLLFRGDSEIFYLPEILELLIEHPDIIQMNTNVQRSEMYK